jgi:hypothetical protein
VARRRQLTIHPFGATMHIVADDDRVLYAARAALARYPSDARVPARASIELDVTTNDASVADHDVPWPNVDVVEGPEGIVVRCGLTTLRTETASGQCSLVVDRALLAVDDALRMFVEAAFWSPMIAGRTLHAVHSALVVVGGAGLLLRGQSGAGKSTLTYACLRRGMGVCSDDWVYGVAGRRPDRMFGYPWRMWMTPDAAARFPELAEAAPVPHPSVDRWKIPIIPPSARRRAAAELSAVVMLETHGDLGIDPLDHAAALERFSRSALDSERDSLPADWVQELLDRPCYVLRRGSSPDAAAEVLHDLGRRVASNAT